jgi:hypothetical protein
MAKEIVSNKIKIRDLIENGGVAVLALTCMKFTGRGESWTVEVCTPAGAASPPPASSVKDIRPVFEKLIGEGFRIECVMNGGIAGVLVTDADVTQ